MKITLAHGSGGVESAELVRCITRHFSNPILEKMEDAALLDGADQLAFTTDSFVVTPLFFRGGDIGRLCVCGTVNDLAVTGAVPKYLTCGFIIETGADTETLEKIAQSMADTAREAGVLLVAGDTKVIEGSGGVLINTAGVGFVPKGHALYAAGCRPGDAILVSGTLGDHHAAILSHRLSIENQIESDCAPLGSMTAALFAGGVRVRTMRDATRGGLATVCGELAKSCGHSFVLEETAIPVSPAVQSFAGLLGLDVLTMGNEGKLVAVVAAEDAQRALQIIRNSPYGENAAVIGHVEPAGREPQVLLRTSIGGLRVVPPLSGEGLPRIC